MEQWKDAVGYEGIYQVSNLGRVKALAKTVLQNNRWGKTMRNHYPEKILKPLTGSNGRLHVTLYKDNKAVHVNIYRLVAKAFVPNPNNYNEVNHINENIQDDRADNLEWCTHIYNMRYGTRKERAISKMRKTKGRSVVQMNLDGSVVAIYECVSDAARAVNKPGNTSNIYKCMTGEIKTCYGYKWKFNV